MTDRDVIEIILILLVFLACLIGIALWANGVWWGALVYLLAVVSALVLNYKIHGGERHEPHNTD